MRKPPDWYRREIKRDFLLNDKENLSYDMIVKASYKTDGFSAHLGSRDIYDELKGVHPDLHYTEYKAGELKERYGINPHCSWVPAGQDNEVKEWLFLKSK